MNDPLSGIVIFVSLVSIIQYALTKDKSYLYYGVYVLCHGFYFVEVMQSHEYGFVTLPIGMEYKGGISINVLLISYVSSYLFYEYFFQLKEKAPKTHKLFRRFIIIQIWIVIIHTIVVYLFLSNKNSQIIVSYFSLIPVIIMSFFAYYHVWKINTKLSRIVLIGTGFLFIGSVIGFVRASNNEILPSLGHFLNTTKIGFVLELVFFSVALAYRSVILKGEKEQVLKEKELIQFQKGFYTNIAHEIRTPLTMILGLTNELKDKDEFKQKVVAYGEQLLQITDQAINRSQLESGNIQARYTYNNILPFLNQILAASTSAPIKKADLHKNEVYLDYDQDIIRKLIDHVMSFGSSNNLMKPAVELTSDINGVQIKFIIKEAQHSILASKWSSYFDAQLLGNYTKDFNMSIDTKSNSRDNTYHIILSITSGSNND